MKAEETVIDDAEITITGKPNLQESVLRGELKICVEPLLKQQAQISFKAGIEQGHKDVVEWGDETCPHGTLCADTSKASKRECDKCWYEQLKEWGINQKDNQDLGHAKFRQIGNRLYPEGTNQSFTGKGDK